MLNLRTHAAIATLLFAGAAGAATSNGIANGGFETPAGSLPAGWLTAPTGNPAALANDAHTGSHSVLLTVPAGFGASTLFQDSAGHGGLAPLGDANVGDTPMLSFWAKGDASTTGNATYALRYLGASGILVNSGEQFFHSGLSTNAWTQFSFQGAAIPTGTTSVFIEINSAVGPLLDGRINAVYIDDVQLTLTTAPVPEPETYALLIAGLGVVGAMARRRRV